MDILLVEDEPQLAGQVSRALVRAGHAVTHAGDGPGALEAVTGKRFDLVVLDVNLPGCDGFEVLGKIRQAGLPVRVLMLTARSEVGDRVAGLKAGADDYLTKPFALEELLARVDVLGRRTGNTPEAPEPVLRVGTISMDVAKRMWTNVQGWPKRCANMHRRRMARCASPFRGKPMKPIFLTEPNGPPKR
jgi:DNA-binding response OmpR family regulator